MLNVSIVMYQNTEYQLKKLIKQLLVDANHLIHKIYLLDNSPKATLSCLANLGKNIAYMASPVNLGYAVAHNIALKQSVLDGVKYHLVLNPDISLEINTLSELKKYMDNHMGVGVVMPDVKYPDGSRQYLCKLLPTPLTLFSRRFLPKYISRKFDKKYNLLNINYTKVMNVPSLSGCFMFLRVSVIEKVGYFDPRYFLYLEDVDLIRRIHVHYKTIYYPFVSITHDYNRGSYRSYKLMFYHICSAIKYFNKFGWIFDPLRYKINKNKGEWL